MKGGISSCESVQYSNSMKIGKKASPPPPRIGLFGFFTRYNGLCQYVSGMSHYPGQQRLWICLSCSTFTIQGTDELTPRNLAILVTACEPAVHVGKEHGNLLLRYQMIPSYNHKKIESIHTS